MASISKTTTQSELAADKDRRVVRCSTCIWFDAVAPLVILPCSVFVLAPASWPPWVFMWAIAFAMYAGCKWLSWRWTPVRRVPIWRHAGYLLAWPGMDARAFLASSAKASVTQCAFYEWFFALAKLGAGVFLFWGVARFVPPQYPLCAGWIGMLGFGMMLHFGLFHLLSCVWRTFGIEARPLMNWPLISASIGEFWGVRWNTAFRDLAYRFLFRPLLLRIGAWQTVLVVFFFSGLIHDLVISVPARGGYGGPTAFFLLQGLAILMSRSDIGSRIGLRSGISGWGFAMMILVPPAFVLFQPIFIRTVMVPFMQAMGAIG